jgi:hypothetical protein
VPENETLRRRIRRRSGTRRKQPGHLDCRIQMARQEWNIRSVAAKYQSLRQVIKEIEKRRFARKKEI